MRKLQVCSVCQSFECRVNTFLTYSKLVLAVKYYYVTKFLPGNGADVPIMYFPLPPRKYSWFTTLYIYSCGAVRGTAPLVFTMCLQEEFLSLVRHMGIFHIYYSL